MNQLQADSIALSIENLYHRYYDRDVLKGISFAINKGEICALIGENCAGKTTLLRIIAGFIIPKTGNISVCGRELNAGLQKRSSEREIYFIEQEPQMVEMLTVEETIFLGWELTTAKWAPTIRKREHQVMVQRAMEELGVMVPIDTRISELSLYDRKIVLLIRCFLQKVKVLLMDDPMLGFSKKQKLAFAEVIRKLSKSGLTVLFTSYQYGEIEMLAERIIVLSEGSVILDGALHENDDVKDTIYSITGLSKKNRYPKSVCKPGQLLFEMRDVSSTDGYLKEINLHFGEGEIIGIIPGNEKEKENLITLFTGESVPSQGLILWKGSECIFKSIEDAVRRGISFLSDRNVLNVYQDKSVEFYVALPNLDVILEGVYLSTKIIRDFVAKYLRRIHSGIVNIDDDAGRYSIGFQKKVSLARIVCTDTIFHVIVEPTAGLDNVSCIEIYNVINQLAIHHHGVVLISMSADELIGMCDRIYTIAEGRVKHEYKNNYSQLMCVQ